MANDNVELENRVRKILLETPYAILTTVSEDSKPHARWMSPIFATGSLKEFHALAAPRSRKVAHIRTRPEVNWVFTSPQFNDIVNLYGTATVEEDPVLRALIWEHMEDKQRAFILRNDENLEFVIIQTQVQTVEYLRPRTGETTPNVLNL
jgi:general stress protein 26